MKIFCTSSRGGDPERYIAVLRALGHRVQGDSTEALLGADALFLCISGPDNSGVKADLNLVLDRGTPVAYVLENGAQLDQGLALQLSLAVPISAEDPKPDLERWLNSLGKRRKRRRSLPLAAAVVLAAVICAGVLLLRKPAEAPALPVSAALADPAPGAEYLGDAPEELLTLDLSGRGLTDIAFLEAAVNLEELSLRDNAVSDISPLASLTKLRRLDLRGNQITDINILLALDSLERVDLRDNPIADPTALDYLEDVEIIQ